MPKVLDIMMKTLQLNPMNIDGLPAHLVDRILIRLPLQDAVRTSMLAKKWRYTWAELSELVFDDSFCAESIRNSQSKLLMAIYQVLFIHCGPLHKLSLSLSNLESCSKIDHFVLVALRKGVKHVTLDIKKGDPYRLPSSIFVHGQQLEILDLRSCVFKPPPGFKGFSKLTNLVLEEVVGIRDYEVSSLISNSPLLKKFRFRSTTTYSRLDIVNPNLKSLTLQCLYESIYFKKTPKLSAVAVGVHHLTNTNGLIGNGASGKFTLCGKLPALKGLGLNCLYSKNTIANKTPSSILNDLCHLKALVLASMCLGTLDDVFSVLCLMRNSPKLEQLTIGLFVRNNAADIELSKVEDFSDVTLDHLKEVKLIYVRGTKCELQFIKLILAKSPLLDNFIMKPVRELVGEKGFRFFKELSVGIDLDLCSRKIVRILIVVHMDYI